MSLDRIQGMHRTRVSISLGVLAMSEQQGDHWHFKPHFENVSSEKIIMWYTVTHTCTCATVHVWQDIPLQSIFFSLFVGWFWTT